jgi:hypothetical protein
MAFGDIGVERPAWLYDNEVAGDDDEPLITSGSANKKPTGVWEYALFVPWVSLWSSSLC